MQANRDGTRNQPAYLRSGRRFNRIINLPLRWSADQA